MKANTSVGLKPADVFKTFPEFSKLTLADRQKYENLIKGQPPASFTSFFNLMTWWNTLDTAAISVLNGNLILSYWMPGDSKRSGLSVVGERKLDETICAIFDFLESKQEKARLVHVPEHVLRNLRYPEMFRVKPATDDDEYVMAVSSFYPLDNMNYIRRFRTKKFMARHPEETIQVKSLDLDLEENRRLLLESTELWQSNLMMKNFVQYMDDAMKIAIKNHDELGTKNLCLYIHGELQAFIIYYHTQDRRYVTLSNALFNNDHSYMFDYAVYAFAQWFADRGVSFVNLDVDLGLAHLRMIKLSLGPSHYFRHFTIEPALK